MRPFNFAETKIAERIYCQKHLNQRLRIIALLMVLSVLVAAGSCACKMMIADKAMHAKSDLADIQGRSARIKREMTGIKSKLMQTKWKKQLSDGSKRWLDVLDSALRSVPSGVWLNKIENSPKDSAVLIEGSVSSFELLSVFTGALRNSAAFTEVRLGATKVNTLNGISTIDFSLMAKTKTTAPVDATNEVAVQVGQVPNVQESP